MWVQHTIKGKRGVGGGPLLRNNKYWRPVGKSGPAPPLINTLPVLERMYTTWEKSLMDPIVFCTSLFLLSLLSSGHLHLFPYNSFVFLSIVLDWDNLFVLIVVQKHFCSMYRTIAYWCISSVCGLRAVDWRVKITHEVNWAKRNNSGIAVGAMTDN